MDRTYCLRNKLVIPHHCSKVTIAKQYQSKINIWCWSITFVQATTLWAEIGLISMVTYCSLHMAWALDCVFGPAPVGRGYVGQLHFTNAKCPMAPWSGMLLWCPFVVWPSAIVPCHLPCPLDLCLLPYKVKNYSLTGAFSLLLIYLKLLIAYYSSQEESTRSPSTRWLVQIYYFYLVFL